MQWGCPSSFRIVLGKDDVRQSSAGLGPPGLHAAHSKWERLVFHQFLEPQRGTQWVRARSGYLLGFHPSGQANCMMGTRPWEQVTKGGQGGCGGGELRELTHSRTEC